MRTIRSSALFVLLALLSAQAPAPSGGSIVGRVRPSRGGKVVDKVEDVWAWLEPVGHSPPRNPGKARTYSIVQRNIEFFPHTLLVPSGATVTFPNADLEDHNVFSPSDPPGQFNLGRYRHDAKGKSQTFSEATEDKHDIDIFCDIHQQMWASIKVVDSPWTASVHPNGDFAIAGVPPGEYRVFVWSPGTDVAPSTKSVTVEVGAAVAIDEIINLPLGKPDHAHKRYDGSEYRPYRP